MHRSLGSRLVAFQHAHRISPHHPSQRLATAPPPPPPAPAYGPPPGRGADRRARVILSVCLLITLAADVWIFTQLLEISRDLDRLNRGSAAIAEAGR